MRLRAIDPNGLSRRELGKCLFTSYLALWGALSEEDARAAIERGRKAGGWQLRAPRFQRSANSAKSRSNAAVRSGSAATFA